MATWEQTYSNGRIPLAALTQVAPGVYMQPDAAIRVARMGSAFLAATGLPLKSIEGYRDFARQVFYRNEYLAGRGNPAAIPGTSPHGMAVANDFAWPMTSWTTAGQKWFLAHAADYEQSSAQGRGDDEPWHKVDVGVHTTTTTTSAGGGATPIGEPELKTQSLSFPDTAPKTITPGGFAVFLRDKTNKVDQNIAGSVGQADFYPHISASGKAGDIVELVLQWENKRYPDPWNHPSYHYVERLMLDEEGKIEASRAFTHAVDSGDMVFMRVSAPATNKGPVSITRLAADTNTILKP